LNGKKTRRRSVKSREKKGGYFPGEIRYKREARKNQSTEGKCPIEKRISDRHSLTREGGGIRIHLTGGRPPKIEEDTSEGSDRPKRRSPDEESPSQKWEEEQLSADKKKDWSKTQLFTRGRRLLH